MEYEVYDTAHAAPWVEQAESDGCGTHDSRLEQIAGSARMSGAPPAPDVSVVLTTHHAGEAVKQTIDAVLAQTLVNFELIVVDDCSRDTTLPLVRGYDDKRLRLFVTPRHLGLAGARNQAIGVARGRYIAALGQCDLCHPERLARQAAYLDAHPDTVLVGAAARTMRDDKPLPDRFPARTTPGLLWWMLHVLNPLVWSSIMIRADALHGLEMFARDDAALAEDFDLYHRLAAVGAVARLDETLVTRRWQAPDGSRVDDLRMTNSAAKILAEAYAPWFGPASQAYADLMVTHLAAGRPVSEASTLNRIAAVLQSIERNFAAAYKPDAESRALILAEMSRMWWAAARAAIRAGTISQAMALENRPDFAAADGLTPKDLFRSGLIGGFRARRGG